MEPFGTFQPDPNVLKKIEWCHRLPANWIGKQLAQLLRKQVMRKARLPMDLTLGSIKLRCYLDDNVSERGFVFMPWRWDQTERQVMLDALPPEGVMVDVGANVGIYSALAATVLNRLGTVLAIEPNPTVFDRLSFNLQATREGLTEKPRLELIQQGVSDQAGSFDLYLDPDNLGASSLLDQQADQAAIKVDCQPLLDIIRAQNLSRIDVIKCDIEGAEDRALIPFLLDAPHHLLPQCFIFENNQDQWQGDLLAVLKQRDYIETHQTRLNLIYQLRQPIHFTARQKKKYKGVVPAIT